jgi:Tol biopolymer transport system component
LVFASDRAPDYGSEVYSLDLAGGARRDVSRNENGDSVVALRGRHVAFLSDRGGGWAVYEARLGSRAPARRILALPRGSALSGAAWSPSGDVFAVALEIRADRSVIELVDRSGRRLAQFSDAHGPPVWSADGERLAFLYGPPGRSHVIRVADVRGRVRFSRPGDHALWAQTVPRVVIVRDVMASTIVDDERGRAIRRFVGTPESLSPDGKTLVLDRSLQTRWLASIDTGRLRRLPTSGAYAAFSPDGKHIELDSKHGAIILSIATGRTEAHLPAFGEWLADSRSLVMLDRPGNEATVVTRRGHLLRGLKLISRAESKRGAAAATPLITRDSTALVYTVSRSPAHQLYEQLASGALRQITSGRTDHRDPVSSPDGRLIADDELETPSCLCELAQQIGVLATDGSTPPRLLPTPGNASHPTWSPDETHIAYFTRTSDLPTPSIIVAQADGSQPVVLTGDAGVGEPSWAPDGSMIALVNGGIVVVASDGSTTQHLTGAVPAGSNISLTGAPAWSPDSTTLVFAGADGLHLIGRDGTGIRRILAMPGIHSVAWSPDGALIAIAACQQECSTDSRNDIWTVRPDGSELHRITHNIADDNTPTWIPAP